MKKLDLVNYLDTYLKIADFQDDSKNGLQVDTDKKEIKKIGYAVDATGYIFDKAIKEKINFLIVHHGMFRGIERPIVETMYSKVKKLITNNIALYACHLPLDVHPKVGNNAVLLETFAKYFNIKTYKREKFGDYNNQTIGRGIKFKNQIPFSNLKKFCKAINIEDTIYNFGHKKDIQSVAFISGGGMSGLSEAHKENYDLLITGEGAHHEHIHAKEIGQSMIVGGHYETEVFGPQALAQHLKKKFKLKIVFLDEKY